MSQYRNKQPNRTTRPGYGRDSHESTNRPTYAANRINPLGADNSRRPPSAMRSSAPGGRTYGGNRSYTQPHTASGARRFSNGPKWLVLALVVMVMAAVITGVFLFCNNPPEATSDHIGATKETPVPTSTATPAVTVGFGASAAVAPTIASEPMLLSYSQPQAELYSIYDVDFRWYVQQLTTDEAQLFAVLYDSIAAAETQISLSGMQCTEQQLDRVLTALRYDCPELVHWNREATITNTTTANFITSVTFSYTYPEKEENLRAIRRTMEAAKALDSSADNMVEKEYKLYRQIVQRTSFDRTFEYCANADGVLLYDKAKGSGYASAFALACRLHGIPCIYVAGEVFGDVEKESHAWNCVQIDDAWYFCDAAWDRFAYEEYQGYPEQIQSFLSYFNVTAEQISKTHQVGREVLEQGWILPVCTATAASFWNTFGSSTVVTRENWESMLVQQLNEVQSGRRELVVLRIEDGKQYEQIKADFCVRLDQWMSETKNHCRYAYAAFDRSQLILLFDFQWTADHSNRNSGLQVNFLDVGEGDAAIVRCGEHVMLIDGGTSKNGSSKLYSYLLNNGIAYVDAIVASHPHSDHVGGLSGALAYEGCTFGVLYSPVLSSDNKSFNILLEKAAQRGGYPVVPDIGTQFPLGDAVVTFLSPEAHKSYENINNKSLVVRIDYGEVSFLFTGDAMENAELDMLKNGVDLDVDVLKVAHHGADSSSGMAFLRAVSPSIAVISCELNNAYHPGAETLKRLQQTAGLLLRTDEMGEITIFTDGEKLTYTTER